MVLAGPMQVWDVGATYEIGAQRFETRWRAGREHAMS